MHTRVTNYLFKKTVALLETWKGRPPPHISCDIEGGLLNATQPSPNENNSQHRPARERSNNTPTNLENANVCPQSTSPTSTGLIELNCNQPPQCTEGPARFVIVNDGSKDCLALLVTERFLAKSRAVHEDNYHLTGKQGPLQQVRRDARNAEASVNLAGESVVVAEEQADELGQLAQKRESELVEARRRKNEIEKGAQLLESSIAASRKYTQWVLETAMAEANLLEPHRPLTPYSGRNRG